MSELRTHVIKDKHELELGESPIVTLTLQTETLAMHYGNTTIRRFGSAYEDMNHLEYLRPNGRLLGVPFLQAGESTIEILDELDFPSDTRPFPRQDDLDWFSTVLEGRANVDLSATYTPNAPAMPETTSPVASTQPPLSMPEIGGLILICAAEHLVERFTRPLQ